MTECDSQLLFYKLSFYFLKEELISKSIPIILCNQVLLAMHIKFYLKTYFILETCFITDIEHGLEDLKIIEICLNCFEWNLQRI
jgi:hypothetical protein